MLEETRLFICKHLGPLMEANHKLGFSQENFPVDTIIYQRLVGKLITSLTRPDISFHASVISQFMNNPNEEKRLTQDL